MELAYFITVGLGIVLGLVVTWIEHQWFKTDIKICSICRAVTLALLLAVVFSFLYYQYGFSAKTFGYAALAAILCVASLTDIDSSTIPNVLIIIGLVIWGVTVWFVAIPIQGFGVGSSFSVFFGESFISVMFDCLLGAFVTAGSLLLIAVVYEQVTNKPSLGGGDIKLLFVIGLYLGLVLSVFNLLLACLFGLALAPIWRKSKLRRARETENLTSEELLVKPRSGAMDLEAGSVKTFPFAPAITVATLFVLSLGSWLPF